MTWNVDGELITKTIDGVQNVVTEVPWSCSEVAGTVTAKQTGVVDLEYNPSSPFTAYADLTEAQVVGWVQDALGPEAVAFYEAECLKAATFSNNDPTDKATLVHVFANYVPPETKQPAPWAAA